MTGLRCNVSSCTHNENECCCLSSIKVGGNNASKCDDTCCASFQEAKSNPTNSCKSPNTSLTVSCEAVNCVYNKGKKCSADHISISGVCASDSCETVCASFKNK